MNFEDAVVDVEVDNDDEKDWGDDTDDAGDDNDDHGDDVGYFDVDDTTRCS